MVLANEMYGDVWYLPGGNTSVAHYISDANANYIMKDNKDEKALTMSFEEVYESRRRSVLGKCRKPYFEKEMLV